MPRKPNDCMRRGKADNDTEHLKEQHMDALNTWIAQHHLTPAEATETRMGSGPHVSDVMNWRTAKSDIDTMVEMLRRIGKPMCLTIGRSAGRCHGNAD